MNFKIIFLLLLFISCATPYQKVSKNGGYQDEKLSEHVYRISFQGNDRTKDEIVHRYFLRRCAELTKEKGYQYFIILKTNDKTKSALVIQEGTPSTSKKITAVAYSSDNSINFIPVEHKNIVKHAVIGEITLFREGDEPIDAYKADDVLSRIRK